MKQVDFLIIGGSAAGTTAADVIRGLLPNASIAILTDEPHEFYSRVLIPHYIRHKVTRDHVFLKTPEWYIQRKIELLKSTRVVKLDAQTHTLVDAKGEVYQYKKLLITVGGKVVPFDAPGSDLGNILYMRTIDDADKIIEVSSKAQKAVIIGGGFIGLELMSCFKLNNVSDIKVLVMEPYFWFGKLDVESSKVLTATLSKQGVQVVTGEQVDHFEGEGVVKTVVTKSGKRYDAQVVGIGVGIRPDLDWLKESGISINRGIVTNEYLETNLPDIYAAGDCAEFNDTLFERQHILGNWANATGQGTVAAKTMAGQRTIFETASSYTSTYFDGSCSFIGVTDDKFADEIIIRGTAQSGKVTRIFIKTIGGVLRIVGATVVNNPSEVPILTILIKSRSDIFNWKLKLGDVGFDLKNLINIK